jgi:hypothetical protein
MHRDWYQNFATLKSQIIHTGRVEYCVDDRDEANGGEKWVEYRSE